ncbi:hypothetical protein FOZ62_026164, partial [Perkinsus olseni]
MVWYVAPVSVLSLLPHKEIRFIFPSLLALAVVAACGAYRLLQYLSPQARRYGPEAYNSKAAKIMALMARNRVVLFGARAAASIYNYPSGHAMQQLSKVVMRNRPDGAILAGRDNPAHPLLLGRFNVSLALPVVVEDAEVAGRDASRSDKEFWVELIGEGEGLERQCVIHVDVFSAMSGVSRFVHPINTICTVDKTEGIQWTDHAAMSRFSFLMSERHDTPPSEEFELLFSTLGYHRLTLLPLPSVMAVALRPQVFVYRNRHRTKIVYEEKAAIKPPVALQLLTAPASCLRHLAGEPRRVDLAGMFGCLADAGDAGVAALESEMKKCMKEADQCLEDILSQIPSWLETRGVPIPMKPTVMTAPLLNPQGPPAASSSSSSVPADSLCCSSVNDESEEDLSKGPATAAASSVPVPRSSGDKLLSIGNHSVFNLGDQSSCSAAAAMIPNNDTQRSRVRDLASKFEAKKQSSAAPRQITRTNTTTSMSASVKRQMSKGRLGGTSLEGLAWG